MSFLNVLKIAFRALRRNVLRSTLTSLGIIIGIASVITLIGIGNGARTQIAARIARLGENIVLVFPGSFSVGGVRSGFGGRQSLVPADAVAIEQDVPYLAGVSPEVRAREQILANGLNWNTTVLGESSDYFYIRNWPLVAGSMFSPDDVARKAKVAVVGASVLRELNLAGRPIGQTIRVAGVVFRIIGVFASRGFSDAGGGDEDDMIVVPYTSHMLRVARRSFLSSILVAAEDEKDFPAVQQGITDLLRERHEIGRNSERNDFLVRTQEEITSAATASTDAMTSLLGLVAGVSLLVGGVGIMNILLVSVTERTREIGIRLAVGAHPREVLLQFLTEAAILSATGGLIGLILGVTGAQLLSDFKGWPVSIPPWAMIASVAFSAAVGIFFGFYPAYRAAQLDPITALRSE